MIDSIPGASKVAWIQAVEFQHCPGRFDAIQPSAHLGIFEKSRSYHARSYIPLGFGPLPNRLGIAPIAKPSTIGNRHDDQDFIGSRGVGADDDEGLGGEVPKLFLRGPCWWVIIGGHSVDSHLVGKGRTSW